MTRRRWAVLAAVVAVVLLVVADFLARALVENAIAASVSRRSGAEAVAVEVETPSALLSIAAGRFSGLSIDMVRPTRDGVTVEALELDLADVRFRPGVGRGSGEVRGSSGRVMMTITEDQLSEPVERETEGAVTLGFTDDGIRATVDLGGAGTADAEASLGISGGELTIDLDKVRVGGRSFDIPAGVPSARIPLPNVPPDARLEAFQVTGATLEIRVAFGPFVMSDGQLQT